jgi:hypothetical protein
MPKKAQILTIEEMQGEKYPDLATVQRAALPSLSASLQAVIRDLLNNGNLINVNGKIIPASQG